MKKILLLTLFVSSISNAAIHDRTCEIAVGKNYGIWLDWTLQDEALQVLVDKGYGPYRVPTIVDVHDGLVLYWNWSTSKNWLGMTVTKYSAAVKRKSPRGEILLSSAESTSSMKSAIAKLKSCEVN